MATSTLPPPVPTSLPTAANTPFHIAFPVDDLPAARHFYGEVLGCPEGRSSEEWIDFDLFGHQIVAHLKPRAGAERPHHNAVDGHACLAERVQIGVSHAALGAVRRASTRGRHPL